MESTGTQNAKKARSTKDMTDDELLDILIEHRNKIEAEKERRRLLKRQLNEWRRQKQVGAASKGAAKPDQSSKAPSVGFNEGRFATRANDISNAVKETDSEQEKEPSDDGKPNKRRKIEGTAQQIAIQSGAICNVADDLAGIEEALEDNRERVAHIAEQMDECAGRLESMQSALDLLKGLSQQLAEMKEIITSGKS